MIKRFSFILAVLLVLALGQPVIAADGQGKILGNLVNGTAGGQAVGEQALVLTITTADNRTTSLNGTADSSGRFEFGGLNTDPFYRYQVATTYKGVEYSSSPLFFDTEPVLNATIDVYETTADPSVISVNTSHMVIYPEAGLLFIREVLVFNNPSDRTFVGYKPVTPDGKNETLRFSLPAGASHFQAESGLAASYVQDASGVSDTAPLLPGTREVSFVYLLFSDADTYSLQHQLNYPTDSFNLLVEGQSTTISTSDIVRQSPVDMNGNVYQYFNGRNLEVGKTVSLRVSPVTGTTGSSERGVIWLVVALLVIAGGVTGFLILRKRFSRAVASGDSDPVQERLQALAQLDDDFEAGKIAEADYARLRTEKKSELAELLRRQKE